MEKKAEGDDEIQSPSKNEKEFKNCTEKTHLTEEHPEIEELPYESLMEKFEIELFLDTLRQSPLNRSPDWFSRFF